MINFPLAQRLFGSAFQKPNFTHLNGSLYVVRTQAGFKQARKHYVDDNPELLERSVGFPLSYPSFVVMHNRYYGYHYLECECYPVNEIRKQLEGV